MLTGPPTGGMPPPGPCDLTDRCRGDRAIPWREDPSWAGVPYGDRKTWIDLDEFMRRVVGIVAVLSLVVVNPGWAAADSTGQRNGNTGGLPTTRNDVAPQPSLVLRAPRTQVPIGAVLFEIIAT